ncbi:type Iii polyketide Synthase, partial [Roridomyces roridus]
MGRLDLIKSLEAFLFRRIPSPMPTIKITGLGVAYPPTRVPTEEVNKGAYKFHESSPALDKVLALNRTSGIKTRSMVSFWDSPLLNQPTPPTIDEISKLFHSEGVKLTVSAARAAIAEARVPVDAINYMIASTCTDSSSPGYDLLVARELGLRPDMERVLLHGVGCTGGLAGLRLAASLCHAAACRGGTANILVVACEIMTSGGRNELEIIVRDQQIRAAPIIFGDGASALMVSLDSKPHTGIFEIVHSAHLALPGTGDVLSVNVTPQGFRETMSPELPAVISSNIPVLYENLLSSLPGSVRSILPAHPVNFDWPIHTSSMHFIDSAAKLMGIQRDDHLQATWKVFQHYGNTSSASVFAVLDESRRVQ